MKRFSIIILLPIILLAQIDDYVTNQTERKLYISGLVQYGPGFEKIKVGVDYNAYLGVTDTIFIRPGGGYGIECAIGSDILPHLTIEFGLGILRSGKVVHTEHLVFDKFTLRTSLIYKLNIYKYHKLYFGGGFTAVQNSTLKIEQNDVIASIKYTNPKGFNLITGIQYNYTQNLFFYGDLKYNFLGEYLIRNAQFSEENIPINEVEEEYHKYNADGIQVSFGIGYYIN